MFRDNDGRSAYECEPLTCTSGRKKRSVVLSSQREVTCEDWSTDDTSSKYWKWDYTVPDACWRKFLPLTANNYFNFSPAVNCTKSELPDLSPAGRADVVTTGWDNVTVSYGVSIK
jgi:hypothetical protein